MKDVLTEAEQAQAGAFYEEISDELTKIVADELAKMRKEQRAKLPPNVVAPFIDLSPREIAWLVTHVASYLAVRMKITLAHDVRALVAEEMAHWDSRRNP